MYTFQLTASRRGWLPLQKHNFLWDCISTHSLTKRLTTGRRKMFKRRSISTHSLTKRLTDLKPLKDLGDILFQLTASRRGWLLWERKSWKVQYFNSQPHEEADLAEWIDYVDAIISTHSLTKRLTKPFNKFSISLIISTHSLTKRLTVQT